jgi:hypothetical protein
MASFSTSISSGRAVFRSGALRWGADPICHAQRKADVSQEAGGWKRARPAGGSSSFIWTMEKRPLALWISVALLCVIGIQHAVRLPAAFAPRDRGELRHVMRYLGGMGVLTRMVLWFGLAQAHWSRRGSWGRGIAIFALVVLTSQSLLFFLGATRGAETVEKNQLLQFGLSGLPLMALSVASFAAWVQRRKNADEPPPLT